VLVHELLERERLRAPESLVVRRVVAGVDGDRAVLAEAKVI
jgi:hypothetical protein